MTPGARVTLAKDFDPAFKAGVLDKKQGEELLHEGVELLTELPGPARRPGHLRRPRRAPGARRRRQGRHDPPRHERRQPAGRAPVHSFKVPSTEELDHDFLWRYAQRLPARGEIGIFNRSHYEEVLVVRVHPEYPRAPAAARRQPRRATSGSGATARSTTGSATSPTTGSAIVKLFLNLSKEEQRRRLPRAHRPARQELEVLGRRRHGARATGTTTRRRSPRCSPTRAPSGRPGT